MEEMREHSKARGDTRKLGVVMASYANHTTGLTYASDRELMRWGFTKSAIYNGLRRLEKLGELVRQKEMETAENPRMYLVCPQGMEQLDLLSAPQLATAGLPLDRPLDLQEGVQPTRAREGNPIEPRTNGTRAAARGGTPTAHFTSTATTNADRSERAARKSRGRRQRGRDSRYSASEQACPLTAIPAEEVAALVEESLVIIEALKDRYPEDSKHGRSWRLRSRGVHLHALEPLTLALPAVDHGWVAAEFPIALAKVCGRPVQLVQCDGIAVPL
jgi:hypothetical protein